jgi:peptidyl-tRNA hydrolase, PTH1 family
MSKFLIAGLGNIGPEYAGTRHNIGFDVVDYLAYKHGALFQVDRLAMVAEFKWKSAVLVLIKPSTYVNLSGKAVKYWIDKEKISVDHTLVVMDDIALPLTRLRLRPDGSDAGHNGLKSVQESLGSSTYPRLRFGVGNHYPRGMQVEYVLGTWRPEELPLVRLKIEKCAELIESFVFMGLQRTMNNYNKLEITL